MRSIRAAAFATVLMGIVKIAAQAQPGPAFEVASVKAVPVRAGAAGLFSMDTDPGMVRYSNVTLKNLIAMAYRLDDRQIQGAPAWLDDQLYDLAARLPAGTPKDRIPAMLEALLAERFKLAVHREKTEQRVYFLVVAKSGAKLKAAPHEVEQEVQQQRGDRLAAQMLPGRVIGHSINLGMFAGSLAVALKTKVVDHTGLAGTFDIDLKWTPDDSRGTGPSVFTAIQEQLGLKLEQGKAPVEVLMVDHAERTPIEN